MQHREFNSTFWDNLYERRLSKRMNIYIYIYFIYIYIKLNHFAVYLKLTTL